MKFRERSKKGKRRVLAVIAVIFGVVLGGVVLAVYSKNDITGQLAKDFEDIYSNTDSEVGDIVPAPTLNPDDIRQEGQEEYVYLYDAVMLQKEILSLVGSDEHVYGSIYRQGSITKDGFVPAFYEELGREISLADVGVGDVGIGPDYAGICVGFEQGIPVFAYAAEKSLYSLSYSGVCIGNVFSEVDETYCGMYPVVLTTFYDCCGTDGDNDLLKAKEESLKRNMLWYGDALYDYGRKMSRKNSEELVSLMPEGPMYQCNVKVLPEELLKFLMEFSERQGCPGEEYSLYVIDEISNGSTLASLQVALVSLQEGSYLEVFGEWYVTMYRTYEFFPCGADLNSYIEVCGFVQDRKIVVEEDEEGNIVVKKEDLEYGYTTDENGRPIIRAADGSILYLDTKKPSRN